MIKNKYEENKEIYEQYIPSHIRYFTNVGLEKTADLQCYGSPTPVIICPTLPSREIMQEIAIMEDILTTAFLAQIDEKNFYIRYFTSNGGELDLCGHASLGSSRAILEHFRYPDNTLITLHINGNLVFKQYDVLLSSKGSEILFPLSPLKEIKDQLKIDLLSVMSDVFNIYKENIEDGIYVGEITKDIIVEMKEPEKLQEMDFEYDIKKLGKFLKDNNFRGLSLTSVSKFPEDFLYESKVFMPQIQIIEDKCCGSLQTCIVNYWKEIKNIIKPDEQFKILYPFHLHSENKPGSILKIQYKEKYNKIGLTTNVTIEENV